METPNYITYLEQENKCFRYGSGLAVYTERLVDGILLCAAYQDNGISIYDHAEFTDKPAFDLVIDGNSLYFDWEFVDFESETFDSGEVCGILKLRHQTQAISLLIRTFCCGNGFFRRSMEITNTSGSEAVGLTQFVPLKGCLWSMNDSLAENLRDNTVVPYSVGHFKDFWWSNEGNFDWQDIPLNTGLFYAATLGQSGHSSPFFVLRNNLNGGYFVCHMGWSANWKTAFFADYKNDRHVHESIVNLQFEIMPLSPSPARVIAPGETIDTPAVHFGIQHENFDSTIQKLHTYLRDSVLKQVGDGLQPVIYNQAGYMQPNYLHPDMSEDGLLSEIDIAAALGAELFMVDAGWFSDIGKEWNPTTGDWYVGSCLPNDLFPVFDYARSKGMKYGLWVEIESAGNESRLAKLHPDWFISRYGKVKERILDLAKPEVQEFVETEIIRLIERYQLDMFRLDYNLLAFEGGFNLKDGRQENTLWRHVEAIYAIFDRIGKLYPQLQLENCASGGGRMDIGMVSRFTTSWSSDWFKMPRGLRVLNGLSMAFPPEYLNRTVGVFSGGGNVDTQMHVAIMAHPTLAGITRTLAVANPTLMDTFRKYIQIYKEFIRPFHRTAKVYHHDPVIPGADGSGWCALEYVSKDQKQAVAAVFRLINANEEVYHLKFRGLDQGCDYEVQVEPGGNVFSSSGERLTREGLEIRLDIALTSRLFMLTAK